MQILIGRLTADAKVNQLTDGRAVTNFSIALNSSFKTKEGELKKNTTYVNCSYWINSSLAKVLTKSTLVELEGSIGINQYTDRSGTAKANLTFHVNQVRFPGNPDLGKVASPKVKPQENGTVSTEDLPF